MPSEHLQFTHSHGYQLDCLVEAPEAPSSPYLHVFFHGLSRIESQAPPVFARRVWAASLDAVCLFVSDPIHHLTSDSACGWYLLGEDEFMPRVHTLQERLLVEHGLTGTVWHGLSSGGYAAIRYLVRSGRDGLAFVVSPHDDPRVLPQWDQEARPFAELPSMGHPEPTTNVLADWGTGGARHQLHALISEQDSYFALRHLRPIMESFDDDTARAVLLRNGRGHGFISDSDYADQLRVALRNWQERVRRPDDEVEVVLSTPLTRFTDGRARFSVERGAVSHLLDQIGRLHPQLRGHLLDDAGNLLPFVNMYVGEDNVRDLKTPDLEVARGSKVLIMSAVAGG